MNKNNITYARTCVYNCNYHIIFTTKYRKSILLPKIEEFLKKLLKGIAEEKGFKVIKCNVGEMAHVHLFVSANPKYSPSYIVKMLKGISLRKIFVEFLNLRKSLWKGHFWNSSYYIETISSISESVILQYIEKQKGKDDTDKETANKTK